MASSTYEFFIEFLKDFNVLSNFIFFLIGILAGFFLFFILDSLISYVIKYLTRKGIIKNGTSGKRKEEKDG